MTDPIFVLGHKFHGFWGPTKPERQVGVQLGREQRRKHGA